MSKNLTDRLKDILKDYELSEIFMMLIPVINDLSVKKQYKSQADCFLIKAIEYNLISAFNSATVIELDKTKDIKDNG